MVLVWKFSLSTLCSFLAEGRKTSIYFITYMLVFITKKASRNTNCQRKQLPGMKLVLDAKWFYNSPRAYRCIGIVYIYTYTFTLQPLYCFHFPRYIDGANGKVMQDIVSSKLYKEQFDAIQDCFRIIGFSEEVYLDICFFTYIFLSITHVFSISFYFYRRWILYTESWQLFWTLAILNLLPSPLSTKPIRVKCLIQSP